MSQEYDIIDEVKQATSDLDHHEENEVSSHHSRSSPVEIDRNQNHLISEPTKSDMDVQLVQNTSITSDDQTHSHISGLEFLESVRKEDKARKKEKKYQAKEHVNHKSSASVSGKFTPPMDSLPWRNVPRPFHDRTCSHMGLVMLCLSLILIFLGGYALAKGASLACLGAGLWAGAAAAICGGIASFWTAPANMQSCGDSGMASVLPVKGISSSVSEANLANSVHHPAQSVVSGYTSSPYNIADSAGVGKAMAALLVASLISLAMSTLALALTGIGVLRDAHRLASGTTTESAIWVGSVLVFCLVLHCGCCLRAGYYAALTLRIRKCQEKQRIKDLAGERGLYAQQQAWLTCPLTAPTVSASVMSQQFHQQLHQATLPKQQGSTLANRAGLVRMWLGKQGEHHVIPVQGTIPSLPPPHLIMPQIMPGGMQRSSKKQDPSSRMRPPSDPISLPFDYVKNVVSNQPRHSTNSKMQNVKPDLTYNGLDRAIADSFIKTYRKSETESDLMDQDPKIKLSSEL